MNTYQVLIIEDDLRIRKELAVFLEKNGYSCSVVEDFSSLAKNIPLEGNQMVLLDLNLPGIDGFFICKKIREVSTIPIIILTSSDTQIDELTALNLGADSFIAKPYHPQILLAQMASVLRRAYPSQVGDSIVGKSYEILLAKSSLRTLQKEVELTKNELRIFLALHEAKGNIVSRDELMLALWNSDLFVDDNTLTVNVNRLRGKLETIGLSEIIETKRAQGYRLRE